MRADRCPECFKRYDMTPAIHDVICPARKPPPPKAKGGRPRKDQSGYVPPSRSDREPRADYLARVRLDPEEKARKRKERAKLYRDRKRKEKQEAAARAVRENL